MCRDPVLEIGAGDLCGRWRAERGVRSLFQVMILELFPLL